MATSPEAEAALKAGDVGAALTAVKASIRREPADEDLRLLLCQILAVQGDWESAATHLKALSELTGRQSPLPLVYHAVVQGEMARREVFAGRRVPTVLGEPPEWMALQVQGLQHAVRGEWAAAAGCQQRVRDAVPETAGFVNGVPFEWIMDADSRMEFIFELILGDTYYWVPQARLRSIEISKPETLRDLIWARAAVTFANGGATHGFIPVRYPLSSGTPDACRLGRTTEWEERAPGYLTGSGQRFWTTSRENDYPVLDVTSLTLSTPDEAPPAEEETGSPGKPAES